MLHKLTCLICREFTPWLSLWTRTRTEFHAPNWLSFKLVFVNFAIWLPASILVPPFDILQNHCQQCQEITTQDSKTDSYDHWSTRCPQFYNYHSSSARGHNIWQWTNFNSHQQLNRSTCNNTHKVAFLYTSTLCSATNLPVHQKFAQILKQQMPYFHSGV